MNLKKFLVLSYAVLAFGNVANAVQDENDPLKAFVYNNDVSYEIIDFGKYNNAINQVKKGISQDILRILDSEGKQFQDDIISKLGISELLFHNKNMSAVTDELINNRRQKQLNKADDNFSQDRNSAMELLAIIQTMKDIKQVTEKDLKYIKDNYQYNLFKDIADNIDSIDMEKLKKVICDNYDKHSTSINFSFLVATLNEIIKSSKYMLNENSDGLKTIISSKNDGTIFFKSSMNGKVFSRYTFESRDGNLSKYDNAKANIDENDYYEEKINLNEIMKEINTAWAMDKSEYNTLLMNSILKEKDIVTKIKEGTLNLPSSVNSVDELLKLLTDIKNGKIQKKTNNPEKPIDHDNSNNADYTKFQEEIRVLNEKIKELENNKNLKAEDKAKLDQYKAEIIVLNDIKQGEFKKEEDTKKLNEYKQEVEKIEKLLNGNPDDGKPKDNKYNIPGITDKLAEKNLYIKDIKIAKKAESNRIIKIFDVNGLVNAGAGIITVDTSKKSNPNIRDLTDKIAFRKSICRIFKDAGVFKDQSEINDLIASDFLNVEIDNINEQPKGN